jgi:type IV secretion system protein VirD4
MNAFDLRRIGGLLLPTILGFVIPYAGTALWSPLVNLQLGFPLLGFTLSLLIASFQLDLGVMATLIRALTPLGLFAAAWLSAWSLLKYAPHLWAGIPPEYGAAPIFTILARFNGVAGDYQAFAIAHPGTAVTVFGSALLIFFAGCFALNRFVVEPVRSGATTNRTASRGPWAGDWMEPARVRQLARNQTGLPLGLKGSKLLRYQSDPRQGWRPGHHMVVAGTRAGKGVACVIPAIIDHPGPVVAIDIKGENFAICRRYRASLGRRQIVLNPFHVIEDHTDRFDPLSYLRPGRHLQRDIATLCQGLIKPETAADTAWISNAAREILEAAIELVMSDANDGERSLLTVADLVLGPNRLDTFAAWMQAGTLCGGRVAQAGAKITQMGDRQQGAILDCLSENLAWLKFDQVRAMLAGTDFDLDELLDDQVDLYLVVPQDMTGKLSNFMRMMMTLSMGIITRQDGRRQAKARILAILDEFTRLGRMEMVMDIATIAAGGGLEAVFVVQDRGTLDHVYTPDGADTLLAACATTRIFGLGRADAKTARWAESALPFKTVIRESKSRRSGTDDINRSEAKERLMDAPAIQEMPASRMLCLISSNRPLFLEQIISHQHRAYRDKLDPNPIART